MGKVEHDKVVFLHVPKTGGGAMERFFYDQFTRIRRNYFLSFGGNDDSRFIRDEHSTQADEGNQCVIERLFEIRAIAERYRESPHFRQAKVLFGHTTTSFGRMFREYQFQYLAVLREPVERTISNISQFTWQDANTIRFGAYGTTAKKFSDEYWEFIYAVLSREYPVAGLILHENLYLRNCMTRILAGDMYLDVHEPVQIYKALVNTQHMRVSFFDEFNAGLQRSFDALGIPIDMSQNVRAQSGTPKRAKPKRALDRYCNAPQKLIDFIIDVNAIDIQLYDILKHQSWLSER